MTRRWTICASVCLLVALGARRAEAGEASPKDILEAMRHLVGDPLWITEEWAHAGSGEAEEEPSVGRGTETEKPAKRERTLSGRGLRARQPGGAGEASLSVVEFETEESARRSLTDFRKDWVGSFDKYRETKWSVSLRDGAGSRGALPGLNGSATGPDGESLLFQLATVGRFAVVISAFQVPELDRAVQDKALAFVEQVSRVPALLDGALNPKAIALQRKGKVLRLRVFGPDGKPVPSAKFAAGSDDFGGWWLQVRDGVGELLSNPRRLTVTVWGAADAHGRPLPFAPRGPFEIPPDTETFDLRLSAGTSICGVVVDPSEKPLAGIRLDAVASGWTGNILINPESAHGDTIHGSATSDADGRFEIVGLGHIPYQLKAYREGRLLTPTPPRSAGGQRHAKVIIAPLRQVRLRVLDHEDKPVAKARVVAEVLGGEDRDGTTDDAGIVVLSDVDGKTAYTLRVEAPREREDIARFERQGWRAADGEIRLERGWTLRGRVVGPGGRPTPARIVSSEGGFSLGTGTTGAGEFEIRRLPYRAVRVAAISTYANPLMTDKIPADRWKTLEPGSGPVTFELLDTSSVRAVDRATLYVYDPDGKLVPRASVRISETEFPWSEYGRLVDGTLEFKMWDGAVDVTVADARRSDGTSLGLAPLTKRISPQGGSHPEMHLERGVSVSGIVTDPEGKRLAGADVVAVEPDQFLESGFYRRMLRLASARTDAQGTFTLEGLARGPCTLVVMPPGLLPMPEGHQVVAPKSDVELRVPKGMTTTLVDRQGKPVGAAHIVIQRKADLDTPGPSRVVFDGFTDAAGRFVVRPLDRTLQWTLTVEQPEGRPDILPLYYVKWSPGTKRVLLARGMTITGTVLSTDRELSSLAMIDVRPQGSGEEESVLTVCDSGGGFSEKAVPYGQVEVRARCRDRTTPWVMVDPDNPTVILRFDEK